MKTNLYLFLLLTAIQLSASAQSEFHPGFVVTNDMDTLHGLIDNRGDILNTHLCRFKVNETSPIQDYKPDDINSYRFINNKYYISKKVTVNGLPVIKFLEFLVDGVVDLYLYRDSYGLQYYIETEDGRMLELKEEETVVHQGNTAYLRKKKEYIGTLKSIFHKAPQLSNDIETARLNRVSLIKVVESYHNEVCTDQKCIVYKKNVKKNMVAMSITGGIIWESMNHDIGKVTPENRYVFHDLKTANKPLIGLAFQFITPHNQRLFFQIEPFIYKSSYHSTYEYWINHVRSGTDNFSAEYTNVYTNFYLRYALLKNKSQPTIYTGLIINTALNYNSTNMPEMQNRLGEMLSCGYALGLGVSHKIKENKEVSLRLIYHHLYGALSYMSSGNISLTVTVPIGAF